MNLKPLGDRVVLKQLVAEETTKSGIVLPGQNKEKPQQAEVVAVGPGGVVDGKAPRKSRTPEAPACSRRPLPGRWLPVRPCGAQYISR